MAEFKPDKIYDAKGVIAGRLGTRVAKQLLGGVKIMVINSKDAVISGSIRVHTDRLAAKRRLTDKKDPAQAIKFPRMPFLMFRRMIKGMLPKQSSRGKDAIRLLRVYDGVPAGIDVSSAIVEKELIKTNLLKSTTIGKICERFGYVEQ